MDYLKNLTGGSKEGEAQTQNTASTEQKGSGGFMSGLSDKLNTAAGGGKESEKNEDYLDKAVDAFQQYALGQGPQDNESAIEQAKDEQISDFIRKQYKGATGKEFPVADK